MLIDFLAENNLINGDKIVVPEGILIKKLLDFGWSYYEAQDGISYLMYLEVKMIDGGEETDSFFIHF